VATRISEQTTAFGTRKGGPNQGTPRERPVYERMAALLREAPVVALTEESRVVVFSDLHIGDGGRSDDFRENAGFCSFLLRYYYFPRGYILVLNGDIEELHKFSYRPTREQSEDLYALFQQFAATGRLYKTVGNHDDFPFRGSSLGHHHPPIPPALPAIRFAYGEESILVLHGHQASPLLRYIDRMLAVGLRLFLRRSLEYFNHNGSVPRRLEAGYNRVCLKKAPLSYVFSRIRLLTWAGMHGQGRPWPGPGLGLPRSAFAGFARIW
jgi:hypothetical protein